MAKRKKGHPDKSELKRVLSSFKSIFVMVGLFSMVINVLLLVSPMYMIQIYDRVLGSRSYETLIMLTLIVVWLLVIMGFLEFARARILVRLGARLDERISSRVYSVMMKLALIKPSEASSQPVNDLSTIRQFATGNGVFAFFDAPWIPVFITVLWVIHPVFGKFAVAAGLILILFAVFNELATRKALKDAGEQEVVSAHAMNSQLKNAEVVQAMGMEAALRDQWLHRQLHMLNTQSRVSDRSAIWKNMSKVTRMMFQSLMLGVGAYLAIENEISAGMIIAGNILMSRALAPLDQMINAWQQFKNARIAYFRLQGLLADFPEAEALMSLPEPVGNLELENVTVVPPAAKQSSLHGVSFKLRAGDSLIVMGPSAAGKSSLLRALLGVWPLAAGKVRLDGAEIAHWNREELGQYVGYLPQDVELFEGTIAQNIARFTEVDSSEVIAAAQLARVDQMIRRLPEGYNTQIGVGGVTLSGGQRQRIGLARAVFGNPKLVILDEPNANLDEAGEHLLLETCRELKKRKITLIMVSHKRDVLQIADTILMLKAGQLVIFGQRDQVIQHMLKQQQEQKAALEQKAKQAAEASARKNTAPEGTDQADPLQTPEQSGAGNAPRNNPNIVDSGGED